MNSVFRLLIPAAIATAFAAFAFDLQPAAAATQDNPAKAALYEKFVKEMTLKEAASHKAAYETGKEYLSKYGAPVDEYNIYVRKWIGTYEKELRLFEFEQAVQSKDIARALQLGQQILTAEPDHVYVYLRLTQAGYVNEVEKKDKSMNAATLTAARTALKLLEQGKEPVKWTVFKDRDDALGGLHFVIAYFTVENSPEEAVQHLIKAAQSKGKFKTDAATYIYLAVALYKGQVSKLSAEYKSKYEGKPETPEGIALYAKVNQSLDHVIDAYARAVALSKDPAQKKEAMEFLTTIYKARHQNSDSGLSEYIADVLNRPLPVLAGL